MAHHEENPEKLDFASLSGFFFIFRYSVRWERKGTNTTQKEWKSRIKSRIKNSRFQSWESRTQSRRFLPILRLHMPDILIQGACRRIQSALTNVCINIPRQSNGRMSHQPLRHLFVNACIIQQCRICVAELMRCEVYACFFLIRLPLFTE